MLKKLLLFFILFLFSADIFADNYSLSFDYMDGYAVSSLTSDEIFGDNYTFTVESWYKNDGVDSGNNQGYDDGSNIVSNYKRSGGGDPYNNFTFCMVPENAGDIGTFNMQGAGSSERYDDGQWHHVVGIVEKTSESSATSTLYVDGVYVSQNELGDSDFISSYNKIYINNHSPFAGDHMMDCSVAGIRVSSGRRYTENFSPEFPLSADDQTIFNLDFSSGDGSTLSDLSSNGHDFTIQGSTTWSDDIPVLPVPPVPGGNNSLSFDGEDDFIQTPIQNNSIIENNTITVSSWIYLEENNEYYGRYIMSNYPAGFSFGLVGTETVSLHNHPNIAIVPEGGNLTHYQLDSYAISLNEWTHVAVTISTGQINWYLNGDLVETDNINITALSAEGTPPDLTIGRGGSFSEGQYWNGLLDEIGIWSHILSNDEIQDLYNHDFQVLNNNALSFWDFNDG
ncbi:uncharacterized protein METZ01_LOCUS208570, partial [marine metagenome]